MRFDVVLANPPYSIKQWDRDAFASDPWGRNLYGTPPQGRADYAFWQHILCSLAPKTGRCAILFPHGVLFRQEEAEMRRKLIEADLIECVLGLGPNLFYNSPMEACVVICRTGKPKARRGKILLINAVNEVTRERAQSFLTDDHIERIVNAYEHFRDEPGFARVAALEEIRAKDGNLSIPLYVAPARSATPPWEKSRIPPSLMVCRSRLRRGSPPASPSRCCSTAVLPDLSSPVLNADPEQGWGFRALRPQGLADACALANSPRASTSRVEPSERGCDTYVGLEHLDSQDLHIRRWGKGSDVIGTKLRFRKGDIIFGRRRAYQRKLAVAECDGICSATCDGSCGPNRDVVLPEFLPFL